MIKRLFAFLPIVLLASLPAAASVTISVDAGFLKTHTGANLPDGDLVLLIASTSSGTFGPITSGNFVSGDNIIVGSLTLGNTGALAMADQNSGTPGETFNNLTFDYGVGSTNHSTPTTANFVAGDKLALRWFDNFTLTQFLAGQTPTSGDYGTYTTVGSLAPDGGVGWVGPTDGGVFTGAQGLNFFTTNDAGTQLPSAGFASSPLGVAAVPEPSTYALMVAGFLFLIYSRRATFKAQTFQRKK